MPEPRSPASSSQQTLPSGGVHVWLVDLDAAEVVRHESHYKALLTPGERVRYERFRVAGARWEYLVGRALVRTTLSRYAEVPATAWRFATGEYGRPEIEAPPLPRRLRFNLSHTRGLAAVAVTWETDVGVDVEDAARHNDTVRIADRYFSSTEVAALHALPAAEQKQRFFTYWTLKESYIKARGMGLALPLGGFSFLLAAGRPIAIDVAPELGDDGAHWQFHHRQLSARHHLALAVRRSDVAPLALTVRSCVPCDNP